MGQYLYQEFKTMHNLSQDDENRFLIFVPSNYNEPKGDSMTLKERFRTCREKRCETAILNDRK